MRSQELEIAPVPSQGLSVMGFKLSGPETNERGGESTPQSWGGDDFRGFPIYRHILYDVWARDKVSKLDLQCKLHEANM